MFTDRTVNVTKWIEADISTITIPILLSVFPLQGLEDKLGKDSQLHIQTRQLEIRGMRVSSAPFSLIGPLTVSLSKQKEPLSFLEDVQYPCPKKRKDGSVMGWPVLCPQPVLTAFTVDFVLNSSKLTMELILRMAVSPRARFQSFICHITLGKITFLDLKFLIYITVTQASSWDG